MIDQLTFSYSPSTWNEARPDLTATHFHPSQYSVLSPALRLSPKLCSRASLLEAAHFFSANIAGERYVIETAEASDPHLFKKHGLSEYRDRLINEEKDHTKAFRHYLRSAGLEDPSTFNIFGAIRPLSDLSGLAEYATKIIMFEFISEQVSAAAMRDENLETVTKSLHRYHWEDERNHVGAGSRVIPELLKGLSDPARKEILRRAYGWSTILRRAFFPDQLPQKAGLENPTEAQQACFEYYNANHQWSIVIQRADALATKLFGNDG